MYIDYIIVEKDDPRIDEHIKLFGLYMIYELHDGKIAMGWLGGWKKKTYFNPKLIDPIFHAKEDENIHSYGNIEKYGIKDVSGWLLLKMGKAI